MAHAHYLEPVDLVDFMAVVGKIPENIRRTHVIHAQNDKVAALERLMANSPTGGDITSIGLAKHAAGIISQSEFGSIIDIPFGWDTKRLQFILIVRTPRDTGDLYSYIQGYSDYYEKSYTNRLDDRIEFFINSIITMQHYRNPVTLHEEQKVVSAFNMVYDPMTGMENMRYDHDTVQMLTRPEDIVFALTLDSTEISGDHLINNVSRLNNKAKASGLSNNVGINTMARVLNGYTAATRLGEMGDMTTHLNAVDVVSEPHIETVPFMAVLADMKMSTSCSSFTKEDLNMLFPNINDVGIIIEEPSDAIDITFSDNSGYSADIDDINASSVEAAKANEFMDGALSAMIQSQLTQVSFTVSNMTIDGSIVLHELNEPRSIIIGVNKEGLLQRFFSEIEHIIFPNITDGNLLGITITATVDMYGISIIEMEIAGGYPRVFRIGTSASNLYSPIVGSTDIYNNTIDTYNGLLTAI